MPTQSERDDHEVDHQPYRSWCEECVEGRGTGEQHKSSGEPSDIAILAFDYLYVTRSKVLTREQSNKVPTEDIILKILVVKDLKPKAVFAHTVTQK